MRWQLVKPVITGSPLVVLALLAALWIPRAVRAQDPEKQVQEEPTASDANGNSQNPTENPAANSDQRPVPARKPLRPGASNAKLPAFTPEREAAALKFVSEHHAELKNLLNRLKTTDAAAYEQAIRDLFRHSERLAGFQERGELKRYELELEGWKVESRIRLLAARLAMQRDNTELRAQLREAMLRRIDLRLERLEFERSQMVDRRDKLSDQIGKLDEQLARARKFRERQADQSMEQLIKSVRKPGGPGAGTKRPLPVKTQEPAAKSKSS